MRARKALGGRQALGLGSSAETPKGELTNAANPTLKESHAPDRQLPGLVGGSSSLSVCFSPKNRLRGSTCQASQSPGYLCSGFSLQYVLWDTLLSFFFSPRVTHAAHHSKRRLLSSPPPGRSSLLHESSRAARRSSGRRRTPRAQRPDSNLWLRSV